MTGGVYFLSSGIRELAPRVVSLGVVRMRGFLRWLVEHGYHVATADVERIVDLDRGRDLAQAVTWLGGISPGPAGAVRMNLFVHAIPAPGRDLAESRLLPAAARRQRLRPSSTRRSRELEALGWSARRVTEHAVAAGTLPEADLYLNMCQGPAASQALVAHEAMGVRFFNRPSSVLSCHRHRLVPALKGSGLAFPATVLLRTDEPLGRRRAGRASALGSGPLWLKRGGVHAERPEDVVALGGVADLPRGLGEFAARGIGLAAVQVHVPGPVVKFYGVAGGALFHAYLAETGAPVTAAEVDLAALRNLAFHAAARLQLDIFGGDIVIDPERRPVLIDLNDWPSFAPIRERAARAIAGHVHAARPRGAFA